MCNLKALKYTSLNNYNYMNCPNCKNPILENSTECEWCGSVINTFPTGSYIDKSGKSYTAGDNVYLPTLLKKTTNEILPYSIADMEKRCPNCNVWCVHFDYGIYNCGNCGQNYQYIINSINIIDDNSAI